MNDEIVSKMFSTREVDPRGFQRTRVEGSELTNALVIGGLHPEVARHHQLGKSPPTGHDPVRSLIDPSAIEKRTHVSHLHMAL